jgi:hypothetical protein
MAFERESNYKRAGLLRSSAIACGALAGAAAVFLLTSCFGMGSKPKGYHPSSRSRLIVGEAFSFSTVGGLAKVKTTFSISPGVYSECGSDDAGVYYRSPMGRIGIKTLFPDSLTGGIYRRNSSPPAYFIFSIAVTDMDVITHGQYPQMVKEIPADFSRVIKSEKP